MLQDLCVELQNSKAIKEDIKRRIFWVYGLEDTII